MSRPTRAGDPCQGLPDLHRHLDGSLRRATLVELADKAGRSVPEDIAFVPHMGLEQALARFAFILELLKSARAIERVASEICEDAEVDGVTTLELRFAPQLHAIPPAQAVEAAISGIDGRAGLILCALYGEDPAAVAQLVQIAIANKGVVGLDLAGAPAPGHQWSLASYGPAFRAARDAGLGRTVHASEGRPADEIIVAIEELCAQRIGHGTTLLDSTRAVDLVLERDVTIEACPTSNVHTGALRELGDHGLATWLERGIRVCVCPDNTLLSGVSASEELSRVCLALHLAGAERQTLIDNGHAAAFPRR